MGVDGVLAEDALNAVDSALWKDTAWAWTFSGVNNNNNNTNNMSSNSSSSSSGGNRKPQGTVNRSMWLDDRFGACNASYRRLTTTTTTTTTTNYGKNTERMAVRAISLCEPAPVPAMQAFCKAMLQYRTDIANVNCQVMGDGACLYRPSAFYVPYAWSGTNQEFAAETVLAYYQSILRQNRFANESYAQLCPARSDFLAQIAALSQKQTQQCPGYQIEYLKGLLETFKGLGADFLYMGYCLTMFAVNAVGSVFAQTGFAMSAMVSLSVKYLMEFIKTAAQMIMPLLNAVVTILFGTSSVGQIIKEALVVLCETYNFVLANFYVPVWCAVLRPTIYGILQALQGMIGFFDSNAGRKVADVASILAMGDSGDVGNIQKCLGSLTPKLDCRGGESGLDNNVSNFLPAPIATRCWTDAYSGSNVFGGGAAAATSFLACTGSDTCARDPFRFDQSIGDLIACAACPSARDDSMQDSAWYGLAHTFGCDTVLKRCACGVSSSAPISCLSNSDCSQQADASCAVVSDLDNVGYSGGNMPCAQCGSLGMQPACVRPSLASSVLGEAPGATCACSAVSQSGTLQTCTIRGASVPLLQATGYCLVSSNYDLTRDILSPALVLDFGSLTIAPCLSALSENGCIGVRLPLASGGQFVRDLVVILPSSTTTTSAKKGFLGGGRRLLSVAHHQKQQPQQPPQPQQHALVDEATLFQSALLAWADDDNNISVCSKALAHGDRATVKWCWHWRITAAVAAQLFNLTHPLWYHHNTNKTSTTTTTTTDPLLSWQRLASNPRALWELVMEKPEAARFILNQHDGLFPVLLDVALEMARDSLHIFTASPFFRNATTTTTTTTTAPAPSSSSSMDTGHHHHHQRRVLLNVNEAGETEEGDPTTTTTTTAPQEKGEDLLLLLPGCALVSVPLTRLISAFWDTVAYYNNNKNDSETGIAFIVYAFPPLAPITTTTTTNSPKTNNYNSSGAWVGDAFDAVFMGYGRRLVDAFLMDDRTLLFRIEQQKEEAEAEEEGEVRSSGGGSSSSNRTTTTANTTTNTTNTTANTTTTTTTTMPTNNNNNNNLTHIRYITGRYLLSELSHCNYTTLTMGTAASLNSAAGMSLLYLTACTVLVFCALTTLCLPSGVCTMFAWTVLFPMALFWVTYGVSPLCWPMIPPRMPHDVAVEIAAMIPTSFEIPRFLVHEDCTVRGVLSDGTVDTTQRCFKQCTHPPFQMVSWQDPLAWILCDASTAFCVEVARMADRWGVLNDFVSSTVYYAEVIRFESDDPDFASAHRLCAFFMSYQLCFAGAGLVCAVLALPYVITTIAEVFAGAIVLLMQAYSSESVHAG
jgi:hypothetical protein